MDMNYQKIKFNSKFSIIVGVDKGKLIKKTSKAKYIELLFDQPFCRCI